MKVTMVKNVVMALAPTEVTTATELVTAVVTVEETTLAEVAVAVVVQIKVTTGAVIPVITERKTTRSNILTSEKIGTNRAL